MLDEIMSYVPEYMKRGINSNEFQNYSVQSEQNQVPAMAYVPEQKWQNLYSPDVAIKRGTLFPDLDKPFIGEGAVMNG